MADAPTVLVVDDDEFQRKLIARILEAAGYRLELAANGGEAMAVLEQRLPDLILMDFLMPELNGVEVIRRIRSHPAYAAIPVIMITGNGEREVVLDILKSGVVDFVLKPFDRITLIDKLARALQRSP